LFTLLTATFIFAPEMFIPINQFIYQMYMVRKTGARKWSRFMAPVSEVCVTGISVRHRDLTNTVELYVLV